MTSSVVGLHVTDHHLYSDTNSTKFEINPYASLRAILETETEKRNPDFLLLTGDIAQETTEETYNLLATLIRDAYQGPTLVVPGNHDSGAMVSSIFPSDPLEIGAWSIVGIDTHKDDEVAGYVSVENIEKLKDTLDVCRQNVLVAGHHPVCDVGTPWLDAHRVSNGSELIDIFENHASVKGYVCGHVHQENDLTINNVRYLSSPSTCWQFGRSPSFALDDLAPGCRWLELRNDGSIHTNVSRLQTDFWKELVAQ